MIRSLRLCGVFIAVMLIMSGCQQAKPTSGSTNTQSSANTGSLATQGQNNSTNTASSNIAGSGTINIPTLSIIPGKAGNPVKGSQIAADNKSNLYYCNDAENKMYSIKMSDAIDPAAANAAGQNNAIKQIGDEYASELLVSNSTIYYSNAADSNKLYSINTDGTNKAKLLDEPVHNLILIGNYIFYIGENDVLSAFDIKGGQSTPLNIKSEVFDSDGNNIYYDLENQNYDDALGSIKIDGSNQTSISNDTPTSITSQGGTVYYANGGDQNKIYSMTGSGGNKTILNQSSSSDLIYNNGWIYYINNSDSQRIYKIKPDGSSETMVCDSVFVKSFAISGNYIYFNTNMDGDNIMNKAAK